jgi:hypothetical protein
MPIDTDTLERWAAYKTGAIKSAQDTHQRIRSALHDRIKDPSFDDFLQGSYANHTIVRGSSDVDIVVALTSSYRADLSDLSATEKQQWEAQQTGPTYTWQGFRKDVLSALRSVYGRSAITGGNKALEVDTDSLPLRADVLVAQEYRKYHSYPSGYHEGVVFWDLQGTKIVNYPRQHMEEGSRKETATGDRFKETVRIFKRARNYMAEYRALEKESVPSYFIENLLYNVPDGCYVYDKQERLYEIISYLNEADYREWSCQNGLVPLFGSGETTWSLQQADAYVDNLVDLWNDW